MVLQDLARESIRLSLFSYYNIEGKNFVLNNYSISPNLRVRTKGTHTSVSTVLSRTYSFHIQVFPSLRSVVCSL